MQSLDKSGVDLEASSGRDGGRLHSTAASGGGSSSRPSDAEKLDNTNVPETRISSVSECSVEVDLEAPEKAETKLHSSETERDCRICHLSIDVESQESGVLFELGCSCKNDLAAAHKHCAEAWFKIKGNRICEICGSIACNVVCPNEADPADLWSESNAVAAAAVFRPVPREETRRFWQGHRFLNFLLACMVFAFVISWLFHFNVPS